MFWIDCLIACPKSRKARRIELNVQKHSCVEFNGPIKLREGDLNNNLLIYLCEKKSVDFSSYSNSLERRALDSHKEPIYKCLKKLKNLYVSYLYCRKKTLII